VPVLVPQGNRPARGFDFRRLGNLFRHSTDSGKVAASRHFDFANSAQVTAVLAGATELAMFCPMWNGRSTERRGVSPSLLVISALPSVPVERRTGLIHLPRSNTTAEPFLLRMLTGR
jgi:hypothetical protein